MLSMRTQRKPPRGDTPQYPSSGIRRPVPVWLAALIAGMVLARHAPGHGMGVAAGTALLWAGGLGIAGRFPRISAMGIISGMAGVGYVMLLPWMIARLPADHVWYRADGPSVRLVGTVITDPVDRDGRKRFVLQARHLIEHGRMNPASGHVRVTVSDAGVVPAIGDILVVRARLRRIRNFANPGAFDYRQYMAFQTVRVTAWAAGERIRLICRASPGSVRAAIIRLRRELAQWMDDVIGEPAGAVMKALIVGDRSGMDPALRNAFQRAGISHLLAISGLHIGMIAWIAYGGLRRCCSWCPPLLWRAWVHKTAAMLTLVPVLGYGLLAGMAPSTQRAVIMVVVALSAVILDRRHDLVNTLAVAALVILVIDPPSLFAVSFQMSFTAVGFIIAGVSWVNAAHGGPPGPSSRQSLLWRRMVVFLWVTVLASLATLPLSMHYFNRVSLVGVAVNALVVPLFSFWIVPAGLAAAVCRLSGLGPLADVLLAAAGAVLDPVITFVMHLDRLDWIAARTVTPSLLELACYYAMAWSSARMFSARDPRQGPETGQRTRATHRKIAALAMAICVLVLAGDAGYWIYQRYYRKDLRLTVLDVGQGSAAVAELPGGRTMLIDGGGFSNNRYFDVGQRIVAPYLWRRKVMHLDVVALSHGNSDHLNGLLFVLDNFDVGQVWTNGQPASTLGYRQFMEIIRRRRLRQPAYHGPWTERHLGSARVAVLYPPRGFGHDAARHVSGNNASLVLRLALGRISFLIPGDLMAPGEAILTHTRGARLKSTVLVVPHHGSRSSSSPALIDAVSPQVAVISAGWHNRYGFPHPEVLRRYREAGARLYRTDRHGAVRFVTDGRHLRVRTVRSGPDDE